MEIDRRKLKGWLSRNLTPVKVEYGEEFSYSLENQVVTISKELPDHYDEYLNFCKKKGLTEEIKPFALCLLHELGHDQTIFFMNELEYFVDSSLSIFTQTPSYTEFGRKLKYSLYYRLPCEIAATRWAIDFINNNIELVRELETFIKE